MYDRKTPRTTFAALATIALLAIALLAPVPALAGSGDASPAPTTLESLPDLLWGHLASFWSSLTDFDSGTSGDTDGGDDPTPLTSTDPDDGTAESRPALDPLGAV